MVKIYMCKESVSGRHGPPDTNGRCPFCDEKFTSKMEYTPDRTVISERTLAYQYYYDPDYGADGVQFY